MTDPSSNPPRITRRAPDDAATTRFSVPNRSAATHQVGANGPAPVGKPESPPPIIIRRARSNVFVPPQPQHEGQLISRDVGLQRKIVKPEISRNRKIAGNLPAWDPLPPDEIHVIHRSRHSGPQ